jgi:hypothetical protein
MAFRHRHFRLSSLIEIAGVEEGGTEEGEKIEACEGEEHAIRHESCPVADGFWFLRVFARQADNVCPALARARGKRL